MFLKLANISI